MQIGSAGLFEDIRTGVVGIDMAEEERCVLCGSGKLKDAEHFLAKNYEFQWQRRDCCMERIVETEGAVW